MMTDGTTEKVLRPSDSNATRTRAAEHSRSEARISIAGALKLAGAIATVAVLYLVQDWVFDTQDSSVRYMFSAWVLAVGAAIYAGIADRQDVGFPWWWTFGVLLLGSLLFVGQSVGLI
jgi:hypothetical protein